MVKQQSIVKLFLIDRSRMSLPRPSTTSSTEETISLSILFLTSALSTLLQLIPYDQIGKYRVPKFFSNHHAYYLQASVLSGMFAFSGAFNALLLHNRPKLARLCLFYSVVSMASAIGLLMLVGFS
jgi:hypothetical protein